MPPAFSDQSHPARHFRHMLGTAPREFRWSQRQPFSDQDSAVALRMTLSGREEANFLGNLAKSG